MKVFDHQSGEYLNIDGAKIYYEVTGNEKKSTLLVLHGGFGNVEDFNDILKGLNEEFNVIGIDSRGQGKSTLGSKELSYELLQKDVEYVLKQLNIDTLNIIGFSDGGIVAYRLASFTKLNIHKLVTIGSRWHTKNALRIKEILSGITGESWRGKYPLHYDAYQNLNPEPDFNHLTKLLVNMWLDIRSSGYPDEQINNIACPVLIVRGDNDPIISITDVAELSGILKTSRLLNIPFAGHVAFNDQREQFLISLNEFFKRS